MSSNVGTENDKINAYYPFVGVLTNEEFIDFINNGTIKSFDDYYMKNRQEEKNGSQRIYVVGKYEIEKDNKNGIRL